MVKIRTRFAPSPTGDVHVGNVRTALFEYLFAKHSKGDFIIRIEDTDRERFVKGSAEKIIAGLKWLGVESDEEIIYQSKRLDKYKAAAEDLIKAGKAYRCFCSKERLEELRESQKQKGLPPRYDGKCREISQSESQSRSQKEEFVIRLKVPREGRCTFDDLIRGEVTFLYREVDDAVLLKSDGYPTYHLASVVDDYEMKISHVLRSEEWLSSTPKHLLLYESFGWEAPKFAHLPIILGTDRSKLSKRHGATSLTEYKNQGYLPEAIINFLALLGWNPGDDQEIFSLPELISKFDIARVGKSPAVFDAEKLDWFNSNYLKQKSEKELIKMILGLRPDYKKIKNLPKILQLEKERMKNLNDLDNAIESLTQKPEYEKELLVFVKSDSGKTEKGLSTALEELEKTGDDVWKDVAELNNLLDDVVKKSGLGNGDVFWPVRAALSGLDRSPSPAELLWALGKQESLRRLRVGLEKLSNE